MYIFRGLSFLLSDGEWWFPHQFTEGYQAFAIKKIAGVPSILWILVLAFILAILFLGYTSRGRRIYAIGTNRESAQIAGIKEQRVIFLAMTNLWDVCRIIRYAVYSKLCDVQLHDWRFL